MSNVIRFMPVIDPVWFLGAPSRLLTADLLFFLVAFQD